MTEGKQDLEKALSLSQRLQKDSAALQAWMNHTETQLKEKLNTGDMPDDIDTEIAWANVSVFHREMFIGFAHHAFTRACLCRVF